MSSEGTIVLELMMKTAAATMLAFALAGAGTLAQETKPVPKNSVRVFVPGCTRGYILTAGPRIEGQPNSADIPDGMHLRMNGPKKMLSEIKAHEGSMVLITGLMRKGQQGPSGIGIGGGVRIGPAPSPSGTGLGISAGGNQIMIDVESWRPLPNDCPSK